MSKLKIKFKDFIFNENKYYLGQQIGDILSAVQDLEQNSEGMGARQLVANSSKIVNRIRGILHGHWSDAEQSQLKKLQKIGVALAKAVEEKDDLEELIPMISAELAKISEKLGVPVHSLATPPEEVNGGTEKDQDQLSPSQGKEQQPPPQQPQQQDQQPQQPQQN